LVKRWMQWMVAVLEIIASNEPVERGEIATEKGPNVMKWND